MKTIKSIPISAAVGVLLLSAASSCSSSTREEPMNAKVAPSRLETLVSALRNSKDVGERRHAAHELGKIGGKEAVVSLIDALDDSDQYVRCDAAWALEQIGDMSAIDPLLAAWDKDETLHAHDKYRINDERKYIADFRSALAKLTGKNFGFDLTRWKKWRQEEVEKGQKEQKDRDKDK